MDNLTPLAEEAKSAIAGAGDSAALEQLRVDFLGKKGRVTELLKGSPPKSGQQRAPGSMWSNRNCRR